MPEEIVKSIATQLPVGRAGHVTDVAAAALFLASPDAGFFTGELLNVNGGRQRDRPRSPTRRPRPAGVLLFYRGCTPRGTMLLMGCHKRVSSWVFFSKTGE